MTNKKDYFSLPKDIHYLNCATMSPTPKGTEQAGMEGLLRKSQPHKITSEDFFTTAENVRELFGQLINSPSSANIAIMPSVSYAIAVVVKNILKKKIPSNKSKIVLIGDEFPSDVYGWHELISERQNLKIETISAMLPGSANALFQKYAHATRLDANLKIAGPYHVGRRTIRSAGYLIDRAVHTTGKHQQ